MTVKPRRRKNNFIDNKEFYNAMTNFRIKCDQAKEKENRDLRFLGILASASWTLQNTYQ